MKRRKKTDMDILFLPSWYESEEEPRSGIFFTEQALALKNENNRELKD